MKQSTVNSTQSYTDQELDKIFSNEKYSNEERVLFAITWLLSSYKAVDLKIIDVRGISTMTDYSCLATVENSVQALAAMEELYLQMKKRKILTLSREGKSEETHWFLTDFGDIIVHLFTKEGRLMYGLDELWGHAPLLKIPQEIYMANHDSANLGENVALLRSYF